MQEIHDDLQYEEETLTHEIQAVKMQFELEQCYFEDQIADYDNWLELQYEVQGVVNQQELEQQFFDDLIADYENWMDEINMQSDLNSFIKYVDDDDMDNVWQHLHATEEHLKYEDDDDMNNEWQHLHVTQENL